MQTAARPGVPLPNAEGAARAPSATLSASRPGRAAVRSPGAVTGRHRAPRAGWASCRATNSLGTANPPCWPGAPTMAANTVPTTSPALSIEWPAGVARPHVAAQGGDAALDRTVAVGILGVDGLGLPDPARLGVERAVERIAEDRRRGPGPRMRGEPERCAASDREPAAGRCRRGGRTRRRPRPSPGHCPSGCDHRVVLAGDDVGVGDHETGRGHPAAALDSRARTRCRPLGRTLWRARRALRSGARIAGVGAATSAEGPCTEGSGSKRARACRIGPEGGSTSLRVRRMTEPWMSRCSAEEPDV